MLDPFLPTPSSYSRFLDCLSRTTAAALLLLYAFAALMLSVNKTQAADDTDRPNFVFILADDLGYGDLSCYGQSTLTTPNIDRMASGGTRFLNHYAGSAVCAPSRCVLLTGMHTGHCTVRGNGPGQLTEKDVTFVSVLQKAGYQTGGFGKWGIGNPPPLDDPNRHGFDEFYGYINMFHAHNYFPEFLIRNGKREPLRNRLFPQWREHSTGDKEGAGVAEIAVDYAPALIAEEMFSFIRKHQQEPFFVYYALNIPHANNEGGREEKIDNNGLRVPDASPFDKQDWPIQEKGFAKMIQSIDSDVGKLMKLLEELKLDRKTIVMFSSDNGPHQEGGHKVDFFDSNGPLRGKKRDLYDGGVKVPMIVWGPGRVDNATVVEHISGFQDVFPTILELSGIEEIPQMDGISFVPILTGDSKNQQQHNHLYWEFLEQGGKVAVVKGKWKAILLNTLKDSGVVVELYNLQDDPGEEHNVAEEHPDLIAEMSQIISAEHVEAH